MLLDLIRVSCSDSLKYSNTVTEWCYKILLGYSARRHRYDAVQWLDKITL